jgi:hypothetical protein
MLSRRRFLGFLAPTGAAKAWRPTFFSRIAVKEELHPSVPTDAPASQRPPLVLANRGAWPDQSRRRSAKPGYALRDQFAPDETGRNPAAAGKVPPPRPAQSRSRGGWRLSAQTAAPKPPANSGVWRADGGLWRAVTAAVSRSPRRLSVPLPDCSPPSLSAPAVGSSRFRPGGVSSLPPHLSCIPRR